MDVVLCCFNLNTKAIKWSTYRDAHPRWCEVSKSPGFWLKLWPDSNQDFLSKLKLVWRFHIFLTFDQTHWKPESSAPNEHFPNGKSHGFPFPQDALAILMGWSGDSKQIVTRITGQRHTEALWPLTAPVGVFLVSEREFDHNFLVRPC